MHGLRLVGMTDDRIVGEGVMNSGVAAASSDSTRSCAIALRVAS
jgi:hypothetical protein